MTLVEFSEFSESRQNQKIVRLPGIHKEMWFLLLAPGDVHIASWVIPVVLIPFLDFVTIHWCFSSKIYSSSVLAEIDWCLKMLFRELVKSGLYKYLIFILTTISWTSSCIVLSSLVARTTVTGSRISRQFPLASRTFCANISIQIVPRCTS